MAAASTSVDLQRLLTENDVAAKIEKGYSVRLVFVANVAADSAGQTYREAAVAAGKKLDLWDLARLAPVLEQLARDWFVDQPFKAKLARGKFSCDGPKDSRRIVLAALPAASLVRLPGISDFRVFAQNVRLGLGRTRVNQEIDKSVKTKSEHTEFLTFHNGLTIVARDLAAARNTLSMNRYSDCNGGQSLLAFYSNRESLTPNLEILVGIVKVGTDRDRAESIAYRTNNQNPISLRDLSANDEIQVQLKAEFDGYFNDLCVYSIKRGASSGARELPNECAGQLLLSLYNRQARREPVGMGSSNGCIFMHATSCNPMTSGGGTPFGTPFTAETAGSRRTSRGRIGLLGRHFELVAHLSRR